jgi:hypothetical protein
MTNKITAVPDPIDPTTENTAAPEPTTNGQVKSSRFNLDEMRKAADQHSAEGRVARGNRTPGLPQIPA